MSSTVPAAPSTPQASESGVKAVSSVKSIDWIGMAMNPLTWTIVSAAVFIGTFGAVIQTSQSVLTTIDPSTLKVWWAGTVLTSFVFLLLFFLVFRSSQFFNTALITLIFIIFVITHVSLLLTQINLRV
jgi:hypothetical protein